MSNVLAQLIVKIGADIKDYSDGLSQATSQLGRLSRTMEDAGKTMTASITLPLVALSTAAVTVAAKFEQTSIAFTHFLGSAQASRAMLGDLYNFAATTPFQIGDVTSGAQSLMAMGFAAKDVIPDLRILGDQLSAVGRTENLQPIILAFGEMKAKGVASMKEIRQMVTDGVIPAVKYLAEGLGVSESQIFDMLKKKAIDSGTAIKLIMAGMQKDTGGMMSEQMASFTGQMSNLKDRITLALKDIGDALLPLAKNMVALAAGALTSIQSLAHAFAELPVPLQETIVAVAGLAAALGPALFAMGLMASSVRSIMLLWPVLAVGLRGVTTAIAGLSASFETLAFVAGSTVAGAFTALIAYAIGRWAYDQIPGVKALGDGLADMIARIPGVQRLIDYLSTGSEHANLQAQVDKAVLALKEHNVVIQQGTLSLTDYAAKLKTAMAGLSGTTQETDKAAKAAHDLAILNGVNAEALKKAEEALTKVKEAYKLHAASAAQVAAAEDAVRKAMAATNPEFTAGVDAATKLTQALQAARTQLQLVTEANKLGLASHRDVRLATEQVTAAFKAANPQFTQWWSITDQVTFAMKRLQEILHPVKDLLNPLVEMFRQIAVDEARIKDATDEMNVAFAATTALLNPLAQAVEYAIHDVDAWSDAFATLGITSSSVLKKQAADALAAYNVIRQSGASTAHDIQEAWVAMEKARQAAAIAAGQTITNADRLTLSNAERALGQHVRTIKGDWLSTVASIKQSISGDLANAFTDVIFRVGNIGDAFKRIGQSIVQTILTAIIKEGIEALIAKLFVAKAATAAINFGEVMSYAAVAAAAAFASTAAIPFVGPFLAPAAAATAYAETAAFAPLTSFDKGGFIHQDMIAQLHKGEYVLTAAQVSSMSKGGGAPSAIGGNTYNLHFNGITNPRQMAEKFISTLKASGVSFG